MRRLVVAVVVAALALSLFGCSSSSPPAATPAPAATAPTPPVAAGAAALLPAAIGNRSENETTTFVAFPTAADVPADLTQKISVERQPTLILFYDAASNTSKEVRKIIDAVRTKNRGVVDLVAYDIGKYTAAAPDGTVSVQSTLASDTAAKQAILFARDPTISVTLTPFIVITDGQGYITYKHSGLIDQALLEREVLRAAR